MAINILRRSTAGYVHFNFGTAANLVFESFPHSPADSSSTSAGGEFHRSQRFMEKRKYRPRFGVILNGRKYLQIAAGGIIEKEKIFPWSTI